MPLYLIDANVLIRANTDYYPLDRVPQFWEWLIEKASEGLIKMPFEIYDEIARANGDVRDWLVQGHVRDALLLDESVDGDALNHVFATGYAADLNDTELEEAGRDPFLVAYAFIGEDRVVVTKEVSKPSKKRGRRKMPDACDDCGIVWMDDFALYRALDFRIK